MCLSSEAERKWQASEQKLKQTLQERDSESKSINDKLMNKDREYKDLMDEFRLSQNQAQESKAVLDKKNSEIAHLTHANSQNQTQMDEMQTKLKKVQDDYHTLETKHNQLHASHLTSTSQLQVQT